LAALLLNFFAAETIIRANPVSPFTNKALAPLSIVVPLIFADSSLARAKQNKLLYNF